MGTVSTNGGDLFLDDGPSLGDGSDGLIEGLEAGNRAGNGRAHREGGKDESGELHFDKVGLGLGVRLSV